MVIALGFVAIAVFDRATYILALIQNGEWLSLVRVSINLGIFFCIVYLSAGGIIIFGITIGYILGSFVTVGSSEETSDFFLKKMVSSIVNWIVVLIGLIVLLIAKAVL